MPGPQQYCTGAAHIFVGTPDSLETFEGRYGTVVETALLRGQIVSTTPSYFGNAERRPRISIRPQFTPVYEDIFGTAVPSDQLYEGADAIVSADFTYWDEDIFRRISSRVPTRGNEGVRGVDWAGIAVGTMMGRERVTYPLWVQFPYGGFPQGGNSRKFARMPNGYRFLSAYLLGPDEIEPGTMPKRIRALWHCQRMKDPQTGDLKLFDHDTSALPNLAGNFQAFLADPAAVRPPAPNLLNAGGGQAVLRPGVF